MYKDIPEKLLSPYRPENTEEKIYTLWEKSGFFNPDNLPESLLKGNGKPFTIVMPPPNANGDLHAGHALFITIEDIFIRFRRMRGYRALWIPGADHAGFETHVVYEKKLEKEGRSRFKMKPQELYDEILAFTLENKKNMEVQVRKLGASCDWSREKFTLDGDVISSVQDTFIKMHKDGLIYRGKRTINWCPKHNTSLSDVETENSEEKGKFYYLKYGPFTIGTARPETKFGDKYIVMHPDDARYKGWEHGQKLELEWINGPITATVIKDSAVDKEFGTGVMTITPWHSQIDFEIAGRHNLDILQIIDWRGKLLPIAGEFEGMKILDAREKIVEKLKKKGLLADIDENYTHTVKRCYKCNALIEPQIKDQWFVKMEPLTKMALGALERGETRFIPENYEKIFTYWMENSIDWNISRQIVWGISIPAWFKNGDTHIGKEPPDESWEKDPDTFDTWFSSGQWPLIVTGYPDGKDSTTYYPTDVMETGHDLIFKWVPRMIIFGLYQSSRAPFHTVYLHGLVNDAKGKKMSKSKGNVINPLVLTEKFGTDALRMGLIVGNTPGTDLALSEDKVKGYKHFANKLWNIARFVLENTKNFDPDKKPDGLPQKAEEYLHDLHVRIKEITDDMENYRIHLASEKIYHYIWHTFADIIIEEAKIALREEDEKEKAGWQWLLFEILILSVEMLHPFMPFITEEIWEMLPNGDAISKKESGLLLASRWPIEPAV